MQLVYQDEYLSSNTEDYMRGDGVLEIQLISNEFIILNLDGSLFEKFTFNTNDYLTQNGINHIIGRKFIPEEDFLSLIFDSNFYNENDKFIMIYVNENLKKIEKSKYDVSFSIWIDYIKLSYIKLKKNNLLEVKSNFGYELSEESIKNIYIVKEVIEDELILVSTSTGCCRRFNDVEGKVKWKKADKLLIDICVID